jgi:hypothetical protein
MNQPPNKHHGTAGLVLTVLGLLLCGLALGAMSSPTALVVLAIGVLTISGLILSLRAMRSQANWRVIAGILLGIIGTVAFVLVGLLFLLVEFGQSAV